jgi:hypothetical protein
VKRSIIKSRIFFGFRPLFYMASPVVSLTCTFGFYSISSRLQHNTGIIQYKQTNQLHLNGGGRGSSVMRRHIAKRKTPPLLHMVLNVFWAVFFPLRPTSFFQVAKNQQPPSNDRLPPVIGFFIYIIIPVFLHAELKTGCTSE